ncbi:hypothetical protein [Trinickia sp.]|uniref:hypothetical protein n=1 Tax=Trinickia sp. TaxID=2571163 RepID=UPI003F8010A7
MPSPLDFLHSLAPENHVAIADAVNAIENNGGAAQMDANTLSVLASKAGVTPDQLNAFFDAYKKDDGSPDAQSFIKSLIAQKSA